MLKYIKKKYSFFSNRFQKIFKVLSLIDINRQVILITLIPYTLLILLNTLIEVFGILIIVNFFTNTISSALNENIFLSFFISFIKIDSSSFNDVTRLLVVIFFLGFVSRFTLQFLYKYIAAKLRQRLQSKLFSNHISADWKEVKNFKVGEIVNIVTNEAVKVTKFYTAFIDVIFYFFSTIIVLVALILTNIKVSITLSLILLPILLIIFIIYGYQSRLSKKGALLRNEYSSDIADRLNGLFQIHAEKNFKYHAKKGEEKLPSVIRNDIIIGICQSFFGSISQFIPFVLASVFLIFLTFNSNNQVGNSIDIPIIASIVILGLRVINQLSGLVASLGGIIEMSGSINPVFKTLSLNKRKYKEFITEPIKEIYIKNLSFNYGRNIILQPITCRLSIGTLSVIKGDSGKGKSTLLNLISSILEPSAGSINFLGLSSKNYCSKAFIPNISYVIQDTYLYGESIRENLVSGKMIDDKKLHKVLDLVNAKTFVHKLGGLDATVTESGRSLSGGQKRRLAIARAILNNATILVLDEITAGLDIKNKKGIVNLVNKLSKDYLIVLVTHEQIDLKNINLISI